MIFKGNPGTGKTTVARIMAQTLYELGYVKTNKFIEATSQDFIAGYVGQTAIKSRTTLDKFKGGVIFIDEAYAFNSDGAEFSTEAISEILKVMESKETVFIFAGYNDEMDQFINMNPGLKSRIGSVMTFRDYTLDELYQIFENKVNKSKMIIADDAKDQILEIIQMQMKDKNFGNGRFINKLFDYIIINHADNCILKDNLEELRTITINDLTSISEQLKIKEKTIGFKGGNV
jgi:replication-associated recombination protein RarA